MTVVGTDDAGDLAIGEVGPFGWWIRRRRADRTANQVTNPSAESGDRTIEESGDRRAGIAGPQAWQEGHLTRGQVPGRRPAMWDCQAIHNMWARNRPDAKDIVVMAGEEGFEPSIS